jgi:putative transposase
VVVLVDRFGVSQRRACRVAGQHRSTQRLKPRPRPEAEEKVRRRLREIARRHPRWGWKTAHTILRREGHTINRKRTRRLWRDEGLRRPPSCKRKRTRPPGGGPLLRAERPTHVWAIDFQFDETADRRRLKLCNIVDEHTREALAMDVTRTCTADDTVAIIERLVAERGAPEHLRMDSTGPSSSPGPCATGAGSTTRRRPTSSPARPGRTPSSRASTVGPATSCSTSRSSATS